MYFWPLISATLSIVTTYMAIKFGICPEQLLEPFSVSTLIVESVIAKRIYRDYTISIYHKDTTADLVELDIVDFDIILGMDWLYSCYASVDFRT